VAVLDVRQKQYCKQYPKLFRRISVIQCRINAVSAQNVNRAEPVWISNAEAVQNRQAVPNQCKYQGAEVNLKQIDNRRRIQFDGKAVNSSESSSVSSQGAVKMSSQ